MEINVKFTSIEWWTLKLHEAKDQKIAHKITRLSPNLIVAFVKSLNKYTPKTQNKTDGQMLQCIDFE